MTTTGTSRVRPLRAQSLEHLLAAQVAEVQVEQDHAGAEPASEPDAVLAAGRRRDLEVVDGVQDVLDQSHVRRAVLDVEHARSRPAALDRVRDAPARAIHHPDAPRSRPRAARRAIGIGAGCLPSARGPRTIAGADSTAGEIAQPALHGPLVLGRCAALGRASLARAQRRAPRPRHRLRPHAATPATQ
jgi:hypothetical protein